MFNKISGIGPSNHHGELKTLREMLIDKQSGVPAVTPAVSEYTQVSIDELRADMLEMTLESALTPDYLLKKRKGFWGKIVAFLTSQSEGFDNVELFTVGYAIKGDYRAVMRKRVLVPEGMYVSYRTYLNALRGQQDVNAALISEVLGPYSRYLGRAINDPEILLTQRSDSILSDILSLDLAGARDNVRKCFSPKDRREIAPIEKLMSNSREWMHLSSEYNHTATRIASMDRNKILELVSETSQYLDSLMGSIEEMVSNGDEPTRAAIDTLTRVSYLVAEHVEAFAVQIYNVRALWTSMHRCAMEFVLEYGERSADIAALDLRSFEHVSCGRGTNERSISRAEEALDLKFSASYRDMLLKYNSVSIDLGGMSIIIPHIASGSSKSVVEITKKMIGYGAPLLPTEWVVTQDNDERRLVVCDGKDRVFQITVGVREERAQIATSFKSYLWSMLYS